MLKVTRIIGGLGLVLSVVGTIMSGVANDRKMKDAIDKIVDAKLNTI